MSNGRVLASASIASTRRAKRRGLIGQRSINTALVLEDCHWIHTIGVRCPIDVAYLASDGLVLKMQRISPLRVPRPVFGARTVIEAQAGSFERWSLNLGDFVEVRRS